MFRNGIAVLLGILFFTSYSFAARPLTTDDAGVIDRGTFEVEIGYDFTKNQNDRTEAIGVLIKHGLTERFDFCVALSNEIEPDQGLGSAEVGMKFSLLQEELRIPAISITFSSEFGASKYFINTIISKKIRQLTAHLNLGYLAAEKPNEKGSATYSGAIEFPLHGKLVFVGEITGEADADSNTQNPLEALAGGNLGILEALSLDIGIGFSFNNASPKWKTTIGLTYGF